jgi:hypothetical protein
LQKVITIILLIMLSSIGFGSAALAIGTDYGSSGAQQKDAFTLDEMLTYAIQDEYLAKAEYVKIMDKFGVQKPFSNIKMAEENHIAMLTPLFEKYGVVLPADSGADNVVIPETLLEAYKTGVQAEINNIAMYDKFLEQDLPYDVRSAFIKLRDASYNHLNAFQNKVNQAEGTSEGSVESSVSYGGGYQYRGGR